MSFFPPINFKLHFRHFSFLSLWTRWIAHSLSPSICSYLFVFSLTVVAWFFCFSTWTLFGCALLPLYVPAFWSICESSLRKFTENDLLSLVREFSQPPYKVHAKSYFLLCILFPSSSFWRRTLGSLHIYFTVWSTLQHLFSSAAMNKLRQCGVAGQNIDLWVMKAINGIISTSPFIRKKAIEKR